MVTEVSSATSPGRELSLLDLEEEQPRVTVPNAEEAARSTSLSLRIILPSSP